MDLDDMEGHDESGGTSVVVDESGGTSVVVDTSGGTSVVVDEPGGLVTSWKTIRVLGGWALLPGMKT